MAALDGSRIEGGTGMRLSITGAAIAAGIVWGSAILLVELIHLLLPAYGGTFLALVTSVFPWLHFGRAIANLLVDTGMGLLDGAIAGALFALFYNMISEQDSKEQTLKGHHI
jgi:hypothetical protein